MPFPTTPYSQQIYFRDDLGLECYYDGTRWLTTTVFEAPMLSRSAMPQSAAEASEIAGSPAYARYIEQAYISTNVQTTNTGANYWTMTLRNGRTGAVFASVLNTSAHAPNAWNTQACVVTDRFPGSDMIGLATAKVGTPGIIYYTTVVRYRYIVT